MAENSKIEWTDHTFNPWMGCTKVSDGCKFCYAEREMDHHWHKVQWGPQGTRVRTDEKYWKQPLKWNAVQWEECLECGWRGPTSETHVDCPNCDGEDLHPTRQRVFCASLADVFEEKDEIRDWRLELFELIERTPNLDWLLLTKRIENVAGMVPVSWIGKLPANVWLGVSVENQKEANKRIPILQEVPAAVRFISCEPLLGYIDLSEAVEPDDDAWDEINAEWDDDDEPEEFVEECEAECDWVNYGQDLVVNPEHREWEECRRARAGFKTLKYGAIDWVIAGGESGPKARPTYPYWFQALRDECQAAGVKFFFKQWGEWSPDLQGLTDYGKQELLARGRGRVAKGYYVFSDKTIMCRIGKKAAGRLLDGREWNEMPLIDNKNGVACWRGRDRQSAG